DGSVFRPWLTLIVVSSEPAPCGDGAGAQSACGSESCACNEDAVTDGAIAGAAGAVAAVNPSSPLPAREAKRSPPRIPSAATTDAAAATSPRVTSQSHGARRGFGMGDESAAGDAATATTLGRVTG